MGKKTAATDVPFQKEQGEELLNHLLDKFMLKGEFPLKNFLSYVELSILALTLKKCNGTPCEAAKILGIRTTTLHEKLKKHSLVLRKVLVFKGDRQN